jgi:nitrogen regulatory protein P-II 1
MIKIEAVIRSSTLHEVQDALATIGIPTFSAYQVQITGVHKGHEGWRNKTSDFIPKYKIEILCTDEDTENIVKTIQKAANTGEKGDGVVFAYNIEKLVKIRSGETGKDALK